MALVSRHLSALHRAVDRLAAMRLKMDMERFESAQSRASVAHFPGLGGEASGRLSSKDQRLHEDRGQEVGESRPASAPSFSRGVGTAAAQSRFWTGVRGRRCPVVKHPWELLGCAHQQALEPASEPY